MSESTPVKKGIVTDSQYIYKRHLPSESTPVKKGIVTSCLRSNLDLNSWSEGTPVKKGIVTISLIRFSIQRRSRKAPQLRRGL